ncbi:hypothetical protein [Streptomyces sp. NPDC056683]|uniref:hypothetical protein n=1 Tax=Streptomyces sp. NPDC056683 TaxID=3345910 RepID=UPI0036B09F3E
MFNSTHPDAVRAGGGGDPSEVLQRGLAGAAGLVDAARMIARARQTGAPAGEAA